MGIPGNEPGIERLIQCDIPCHDARRVFKRVITTKWQESWAVQTLNRLHFVKLQTGHNIYSVQQRLHDVLRHLCGEQLSTLHILTTCPRHKPCRQRHFVECYRYLIHLHQALFLGGVPFVPLDNFFSFFKDTEFVNL